MNAANEAMARSERIEAEAREWLIRLRQGGAQDQAAFEEWFASDPEHADAYEKLLGTWEALGRIGGLHHAAAAQRRKGSIRAILAVAAAILLAVTGVGIASLAGIGRSPADAVTLSSRVGEIRIDRLEDGTRVTLDTNSQVEARYTSRERHLKLVRGRARIAVATDTARPLVVNAGNVTIVHGQTLDVAVAAQMTTVAVLDGRSDVFPSTGAPLHVDQGQQIAVDSAARSDGPERFAIAATHWTSGMLTFDDAPLGTVVEQANRYNDSQIVLDEHRLGALRFSGTFRAADAVGLARMLAAAFHLRLIRGTGHSLHLSGSQAPIK